MSLEEATFARRGFAPSGEAKQERLERAGKTFLHGYNASLEDDDAGSLAAKLDEVDIEYRGFAFEGAAMGLRLQDTLLVWKRDRFRSFLEGPGDAHKYMVHVGAGWVLARLGRRVEKALAGMDPLLGWLAVDGYGFHEGYFHPERYIDMQQTHRKLSGYAHRVFDQGLGRSMWFVKGADVGRIVDAIALFPEPRRADLWSGVGLACTYAGGADASEVEALWSEAGSYRPQMAQGAAFAAGARRRAGNLVEHTDVACRVLCEKSAEDAADLTDETLEGIPFDGTEPAFEVWRQRIQAQFELEPAVA